MKSGYEDEEDRVRRAYIETTVELSDALGRAVAAERSRDALAAALREIAAIECHSAFKIDCGPCIARDALARLEASDAD